MSDLTIIEGGALPAHLAKFNPSVNDDLSAGVSLGFPILSYKGKAWHLTEAKVTETIMSEDGDPVPSVELVIIKANPSISKTYYPDGYVEGTNEKPICYSPDSIAPAADSTEPQAKKCAICPHNQFGSKITDNGARGKACSDFRRLAVAPAGDLERAMLLRVPAASLKELVAYAEVLKRRGAPYQALVTKVGFDHTVAYPKLTFKSLRWLDEADCNLVMEMAEREVVMSITAVNATSIAAETSLAEEDDLPPAPAHVAAVAQTELAAPKARAKRAQATVEEVTAAVETREEPKPQTPSTSGFGGGSKAKADVPAEPKVETKTTVLAEGAMAELDAALAEIDG